MFKFAKLELETQFQDDFAPAGFLGSRLRGGYGFGLLAQLCNQDDLLSCAASPQICECDYLRLFRPHRSNLKLKLVGAPLGNYQNLLVAVRNALVPGKPIYKPGDSGATGTRNILDAVVMTEQFKNEIDVRFSTPTRIENQNARRKDRETGLVIFSDFYDVVYNAAQRVGGLWQLYGEAWPGPAEFFRWRERLLKLSREVTTIGNDLKVIRLRGYSNLQEAPKPLDGFVGSMRFSGDLSPFFELLRIAEIVHIGFETTCGLGAFRVGSGE